MDLAHYWFQGSEGATGYQLGNSLRFRGVQYLNRTPSSAGNSNTYTISMWVKRGKLGTVKRLFGSYVSDASYFEAQFTTSDTLTWYYTSNSSFLYYKGSTQVFRDPGAWYHLVFVFNSPSATASQRMRIYVNNQEITSFSTSIDPSPNFDCLWNSTSNNVIGDLLYRGSPGANFDGYMAEVHSIDGTALAPTEFGEFNDDGVWVPKRVSSVTYGTNGFYLDFSDASNIGADRSGNGNDFTATGFELADTSSVNYDLMQDSPTNNFATWFPQDGPQTWTFSNGNLDTVNGNYGAYAYSCEGTIAVSSGKWYWEVKVNEAGPSTLRVPGVGIIGSERFILTTNTAIRPDVYLSGNGTIDNSSGTALQSGFSNMAANDVVGVAVDADAKTVQFYRNGSAVGTAQSYSPDTVAPSYYSYNNYPCNANFGQRDFTYTPPTGFEPLSTAEQPEVTITDPSDHFDVITDTGANILTAAQAKFANGLWWIKDRANSNDHQLVDSIRGSNVALGTNTTSHNFTYAAPSGNSVAWCWSAPESITNSAGSNGATLDTTVHRNKDSGFAIIEFTGNKQSNTKIYHGLGKAPKFMYVKTQEVNDWWVAYHASSGASDSTSGADWYYEANTADARKSYTLRNMWDRTDPDDNLITLGATDEANRNGGLMIAYAWAEVPGYSAFGSYTGNGSADGPFVYAGFKPAFVLIKGTASSRSWFMWDTTRNPYNPTNFELYANETVKENTTVRIDLLSNGFKLRAGNAGENASNGTYIYAAFAENPFGGSNVSPTTAR
jgi:hypothetical protein